MYTTLVHSIVSNSLRVPPRVIIMILLSVRYMFTAAEMTYGPSYGEWDERTNNVVGYSL